MVNSDKDWTLVIRPRRGWFDLQIRDIWRYRDLVMLFVKRDFVAVYKQTILGPLWHIIRPVVTALMYSLIFANLAKLSTSGLPPILFYMLGIIPWTYFADSLNKTADTFVSNSQIFGKVYFPRLVLPLSVVLSNLVSFGIQMGVFVVIALYYVFFKEAHFDINAYVLLIPLLVVIMAAMGLGMGIIVSSLTTKYRDLRFLVTFGVQLLMFASPVIFPLATSPAMRSVLVFNPMTSIIETFRFSLLGNGILDWGGLAYSAIFAVVVLMIGIVIFSRVEKSFTDTV